MVVSNRQPPVDGFSPQRMRSGQGGTIYNRTASASRAKAQPVTPAKRSTQTNQRLSESAAARQAARRHGSRKTPPSQKYPESLRAGDIGDQPFLDWQLQSDFSIRDYVKPDKLQAGWQALLSFTQQYWQKLTAAGLLLLVVGVGSVGLTSPELSVSTDQAQVHSATDVSSAGQSQPAPVVAGPAPTSIQAAGVELGATSVTAVSVSDDYRLKLPTDDQAFGWYEQSGRIGDSDKSVVLNSSPTHAAQLKALSVGDVVTLTGEDKSVNYRVTSTATAKDYNFLLSDAFEPTEPGQGGLTIVLYHGQPNSSGAYPDRLIISAARRAE